MINDTKLKGDISEYKVITELLERNYNVLLPVGDRLKYDLVIEINGKYCRIQVKTAYRIAKSYKVNLRMSKTNRKIYKVEFYKKTDIDFLIAYVPETKEFYIFPIDHVLTKRGCISISCQDSRRKISVEYKNRWDIIKESLT
jgi:hypothetical protein